MNPKLCKFNMLKVGARFNRFVNCNPLPYMRKSYVWELKKVGANTFSINGYTNDSYKVYPSETIVEK